MFVELDGKRESEMPLFHPHVIKRYMDSVMILPEHIQIIRKWDNYIHSDSIKKTKETALYDSFSQSILQKLLHYHPALDDPNNYNLEQNQTIGRGEVEYALGHFGSNKKMEIIAPLELKSVRTNLDATVPSKNKTPVQQAWDYATELKGTKWVLVSNYLELRLYAVGFGKKDYEVFRLDNLNDPREYAHLLLLLSADHLLDGFTQNLLNESGYKDKDITNKFYAEYKKLREKIITNLQDENPIISLQEIIQYTQVILDRVLFAAFVEDKGLLPINTIKEACTLNRFNPRPIWENFKGLFNAIDKGNTSLHIPGYNGGLFQYNSKLDSLKVNDSLCLELKKLCEYDFASDVSVNILGHILEQSIIDLEEIQKIGSKEKSISFAKNNTKQKREGVYYTPSYITQYIVEEGVGGWLNDRKKEIGFDKLPILTDADYASIKHKRNGQIVFNSKIEQYIQLWEEYKRILSNIKILDPACGSGAFLIEAYDYLIREGEVIDNELSKLRGGQLDLFPWNKHILSHNIYGVDINHEAIEITKLSLWLKTAKSKEKLTYLDDNIKCGDSLVDSLEVSGKLAFIWKNEFNDIISSGGFDVIIGNPPYVFSREKITKNEKNYFTRHYESAQYQINTYLLFIERSLQLLKDKGRLNFIVPNTWLMIGSAERLRRMILNQCTINRITNLSGYSFENVNVETIILNLIKQKSKIDHIIGVYQHNQNNEFIELNTKSQSSFEKNDGCEFQIFSKRSDVALIDKLKNNSVILEEVARIKAGLKAYEVGKGNPKQTKKDVINRIYDFSYRIDKNTYPYLNGKDVGRYYNLQSGSYLKYGNNLAAPRTIDIFHDDVIIVREIAGEYPCSIIATFSPVGEINLFNLSNIAILNKNGSNINLKYILSILCSNLMSYYFMRTNPKAVRQMFPKIILKDLRKFPIMVTSSAKQLVFIEMTDLMLIKNKELFDLSFKFLNLLKSEFRFTTVTKKLSKWYNLTFDDFINELNKNKISLNLSQKEEWMDYFEHQQSKILEIKKTIDQTDQKINKAVYQLYGLTEDEIKLVESGLLNS